MTIQETIKEHIKLAMRAKEANKLQALRGLTSAFMNEAVNLGRTPADPVTDDEAHVVIKREIKRRKDARDQYVAGERPDLAEAEQLEIDILSVYMPEQMTEDAIREIAKRLISEGASQKGKLVGDIIKETAGNADGGIVKSIVDELLINNEGKVASPTITVYSTPTCHFCHDAMDFFKSIKLDFKEVDLTKSEADQKKILELTGRLAAPVIIMNDVVQVGFSEEMTRENLKKAGIEISKK